LPLLLLYSGAAVRDVAAHPAAGRHLLPQKVLNKDEQQGKVNEMIAKGQQHQTEAARR
jgi:hypothetical protein